MGAALEVKTEVIYREIRAHGTAVLRYRIAYPVLAECGAINEFYGKMAQTLQAYAEKTADMRAEAFAASSRTQRAAFREIMLRSVPNVAWADERYISICLDFIAADKESIRRMVRTAHTFERGVGKDLHALGIFRQAQGSAVGGLLSDPKGACVCNQSWRRGAALWGKIAAGTVRSGNIDRNMMLSISSLTHNVQYYK